MSTDISNFSSAYTKWKGVCIRHVEELSLMESYQDVKREGMSVSQYAFDFKADWMDHCRKHAPHVL